MMQGSRLSSGPCRVAITLTVVLLFVAGALQSAVAQSGVNPLSLYQNYFVTGDYVVAGWVQGSADGSGFAPGTISIPDARQPSQSGVPASVPKGADIVAAYLYWATVEGSGSSFAGQNAYFNGYPISGTVLGNPNAPTSWSAGGCSGAAQGSKTMRTYRADVRPYLPLDTDTDSLTYGTNVANGTINVRLADSGKNGNTAPFALGATLVVIYRVLAPVVPLNAIVIYDGAFAPSNSSQTISQALTGFYQPATIPVAKLTHIVANGQPNKVEQVYLNGTSQPLPSLYGSNPPFPGIYGAWDNPTWVLSNYRYVQNTDTAETTSVVPASSNSGCVSWGTIIMSTTVQDTDGDGLLDAWENNQGYTDAVSGQWVPLPGANPGTKDIYIEADYLSNLDGSAGPYLHSHLPKEAALDAVGGAFANRGINVHFDLGPNIYPPNDPYVISYPISIPSPLPAGTLAPPAGAGGNAISEGQILCTDGASLCSYPDQPSIGWKGGFEAVKNAATLGNFQSGRTKSYHYVLFGHSLGSPRSYWSTLGSTLSGVGLPPLVSIVNSGSIATVTIQSAPGMTKPGDCLITPSLTGCSDASRNRITISGALNQTALNGAYLFSNATSTMLNNVITTTFTITTSGVASGTYNFASEPQLAVTYLGPVSSSGQSEFGGGGDSLITLGLWGADDPANCQPDPSQSLVSGQVYCSNNVGTTPVQTGTLMHELGHSLTLTHGGAYFTDQNNPSLPTFEVNCKPNFVSVMNYLFQVRGFVDGGFDYSAQTLSPLTEAYPSLSETAGLGTDIVTGQPALHLTRWYAPVSATDKMVGNYAKSHCDGTPLVASDVLEARINGKLAPGGTYSAPLDWNNDFVAGDAVASPGIDLNYNGNLGDDPFSGFNDWQSLNLQQIGGRENAYGFSGGGVKFLGGGVKFLGGGIDNDGGGVKFLGGGVKFLGGGVKFLGGGVKFLGGGVDLDEDTATSTVDPPSNLTCTVPITGVSAPACVLNSGTLQETDTQVPLTWKAPDYGQIRSYTIWRALGSYPTNASVLANIGQFKSLKTLTGAPPSTSYVDTTVKNNNTYTYFVTDTNKQGAQSGTSNLVVVFVKIGGK